MSISVGVSKLIAAASKLGEAGTKAVQGAEATDKPIELSEFAKRLEGMPDAHKEAELRLRLDNLDDDVWREIRDEAGLQEAVRESITPQAIEDCLERNPDLKQRLEKIVERHPDPQGTADLTQINRELGQTRGKIAERIVQETMSDEFEHTEIRQRAVEKPDGKITYPDVVLEGAKHEMRFGDVVVKQGEKLIIEVKTGTAGQIRDELKKHALEQLEGHRVSGGKSLMVVTQEYMDLPEATRKQIEAALKEKNSGLLVLDVRASEIDHNIRPILQRMAVAA